MGFTQKTINGFEMIGRAAAMEIQAIREDHRAFVAITPPWPKKKVFQWPVRRFEIPEAIMDTYFWEPDLLDSELHSFETREAVEELMAEWGLDCAAFDAPWKVDYPL